MGGLGIWVVREIRERRWRREMFQGGRKRVARDGTRKRYHVELFFGKLIISELFLRNRFTNFVSMGHWSWIVPRNKNMVR